MKEDELTQKLTNSMGKGGIIAFLGKLLEDLGLFLIELFLAQTLGAAKFGLFSLGRNITTWLRQLSKIGFTNGMVKFIPVYKNREDMEKLKGTILCGLFIPTALATIFAFILFIFSGEVSSFFSKTIEFGELLRIIAISMPFSTLTVITIFMLIGFKKIRESVSIQLSQIISMLGFSILFIVLGYGLYGFALAFVFSWLVSSMVGLHVLNKKFPLVSNIKSEFRIKKLFRFSMPLYMAGFTWIIIRRTDILMLGYFSTPIEVGIYTVVVAVSALVAFPQQAISKIFSPIVSELYEKNDIKGLKYIYKKAARWTYIVGIMVLILIIFFSREILGTLFGPEYILGWLVLSVLAFFEFINISVGPSGPTLQMTYNQDAVFVINTTSAILNVLLNLLLIPSLGILGAGIATGSALAFNNLTQFLLLFKKYGITPFEKRFLGIIPPVIVAIILFLFLGTTHWVIKLIIISAGYSITVFLTGLSMEDRLFFGSFLKKMGKGYNK